MRPVTQNSLIVALTVVIASFLPASAWPGKKRAEAPAEKKTFQEVVDSSQQERPSNEMQQTDRSANLTYTLPKVWQATKNPFYGHDLLVKKSTVEKGSLIIADRKVSGSLAKMAKALEDELSKQCQDFKLESNEMTKLSSGVICARVTHTGKVDDTEIRQVNYFLPYIKGKVLLITGTLKKTDLEGISIFDQFTSSIEVKKKALL